MISQKNLKFINPPIFIMFFSVNYKYMQSNYKMQ